MGKIAISQFRMNKRRCFKFGTQIVALLFLSVGASRIASAQASGTLLGAVHDASGAVIPGATVTVTETATGVSRTAVADAQGQYSVVALRPTNYALSVAAQGFKTYVQNGIVLGANQSVTVDVKLEVGASVQTVTVNAAAVQVNTANGTLNQVVDQQRIVDLPLNGRNAANLISLVAGSAPGNSSTTSTNIGNAINKSPESITLSINGSRLNETRYLLDGANNNDEQFNVNLPFPFPDALQEFSVQTSNYSAQYGQNAGGIVNIVTKSGANNFHGDAFEFVRNAVFNARNYFASAVDPLKRNQYGATIGGPIDIPHLISGHDRLFFFFGYQGTRIADVTNGLSAFLPTPAMLKGDFSALLSATNPDNPLGKAVQLKNPATGQNQPGNVFSSSALDPAALNVANALPLSMESADGQIRYGQPLYQVYNEYIGRVDYSLSANDKLMVRYFDDRFSQPGVYNPANLLTLISGIYDLDQNALVHETHIFSPNLLNEFRVGWTRPNTYGDPPPNGPGITDFGVNLAFQPNPKNLGIPVSGFFTVSDNALSRFDRDYYSESDDVSWVKGAHALRFGASFERRSLNEYFLYRQNGVFSFNGNFTGATISDFLLGKVYSFTQGQGAYANLRNNYLGLYLSDDWRATKQLTINLGVRYEPFTPWQEIENRYEQFRIPAYDAGQKSTVFTNAPPGLFFPGDVGVPKWGLRPNYSNFAPRVGLAWDVFGDGKTSVRSGAGLFYDTAMESVVSTGFTNITPFSPVLQLTSPPGPFSNPLIGVTVPFPAPAHPPPSASFPAPVAVTTWDPTTKYIVPVTYNWNLMVEHQLVQNTLLRVAYVGSHGSHFMESLNINPATYIPGSTLSVDQRRPFQPYGMIIQNGQDIDSSYHALQLTLERRLSKGFSVLANYTYSKSLDDLPYNGTVGDLNASGIQSPIPWTAPERHQFDYGPSDFDHAHSAVVSYVWNLPGTSTANFVLRGLLNHWSADGILSLRTGDPVTILAGPDTSQTGLGSERAVLTGAPLYGANACGSSAPCVNYLNPAAFATPAAGGVGDMGKGSIRGPGYINWDMGVFKEVPVSGRVKFQLRGEFFNTFNHTNLNDPVNTMTSGGFGSIKGANDPRISQLALKVIF